MSGERRRSARILELEARKTQNKGKATCDAAEDVLTEEDDSSPKQRRKKVKVRPTKKFDRSSSMTRGRVGRRAKTEVNILDGSDRSTYGMTSKGCRGEGIPEYSEVGRRETYMPQNRLLSENESIFSTVDRSSKQLVEAMQNTIGYQESLKRFVKDLGPTAEMVAERKLQKGPEDLNPHNAASNFQSQGLDQILNAAPSQKGTSTAAAPSSPLINPLLRGGNSNFSSNAEKGEGIFTTNVPASEIRRQWEKIYGSPQWHQPGFSSAPRPSPYIGYNTQGMKSNNRGGGLHQFQPMPGRGSTYPGPNFVQASQNLNWFRAPRPPVSNQPLQQQGGNMPTSGTNINRPIQLADIDQWFNSGRNEGGSNIGAPPPNSQEQEQEQKQDASGTDKFPWTLRL